MTAKIDWMAEAINKVCGPPPGPPVGWNPYHPGYGGRRNGPGKFRLTEYQLQEPLFAALARAAHKAGRAYLQDWLWLIYDTKKANEELKRYEKLLAEKKQRENDQKFLDNNSELKDTEPMVKAINQKQN